MKSQNLNTEEYTSNNISKFWKLLNYSNDITEKQIANIFFSNLKEKYQEYLEISIELFNTAETIQDKIISSILIYQYIKENYNKFIQNEILFNKVKEFLITYINNKAINIFSALFWQEIFATFLSNDFNIRKHQ